MSSLGELWDSLRRAGLEELAPQLVRHGITSLNQLVLRAEELHSSGLLRWQLEAILAAAASLTAGSEEATPPDHRPDLPSRQTGKRANLQAALEAATPNQRQKSIQDLDRDILARSTHPAIEARIRTYMAICRAWEVAAFPLDTTNVRCFRGITESWRLQKLRRLLPSCDVSSAAGFSDADPTDREAVRSRLHQVYPERPGSEPAQRRFQRPSDRQH